MTAKGAKTAQAAHENSRTSEVFESVGDLVTRLAAAGVDCGDTEEIELGAFNMAGSWSCGDLSQIHLWPDEVTAGRGIPVYLLNLQHLVQESGLAQLELLIGQNWVLFAPEAGVAAATQEKMGGILIKVEPGVTPRELVRKVDGEANVTTPDGESDELEAPNEEAKKSADREGRLLSEINEGVWVVGRDLTPGAYRPTSTVGEDCFWVITESGTNGANIIEKGIPGGGLPTVTVTEGQDLEVFGCGTWKLQD